MELIIHMALLAERARSAHREGAHAFPLACDLGPPQADERVLIARRPSAPQSPRPPVRLAIQIAPFAIGRPDSWWYLAQHLAPLAAGSGTLWLGRGPEQGQFVGVVRVDERIEPITSLRLIGPGLERVAAVDFPKTWVPTSEDVARWSRHVGALDWETWQRQRTLRVTVIGAGRIGSVAATTLAYWGTPLQIVDADRVERHNLDATEGVRPPDLGRFKAEVLASHLQRLDTGAPVVPVVAEVRAAPGQAALADAEVAVCCVDNDAARRFVGHWAHHGGLVLLDLGTGVRRNGEVWRAGADVRLILPGEGCLSCWGGLAEPAAPESGEDWQQERAGSLRTLNQLAAHLGLALLEQLITGRLAGSIWMRLEIGAATGIPSVRTVPRPPTGVCADCGAANVRHTAPVAIGH